MKKLMSVFILMLFLIPSVLGAYNWEYSFYHPGDGSDVRATNVNGVAFDLLSDVYQINHDMGYSYPIVLDMLGSQVDNRIRFVLSHRKDFSGREIIEAHGKIGGNIGLISSFTFCSDCEILQLTGIGSIYDAYERDFLLVTYRENSQIKFKLLAMQGSRIDDARLVEKSHIVTSQSFSDINILTEMVCRQYGSDSQQVGQFLCVFGGEKDGEHKVFSIGSTNQLHKEISFETPVKLNELSKFINSPDIKPMSVVMTSGFDTLAVVDYVDELGRMNSRTGFIGEYRGNETNVRFYDTTNCYFSSSKTCLLYDGQLTGRYDVNSRDLGLNYQMLLTNLNPISTQRSNFMGKSLPAIYKYGMLQKEVISDGGASTTRRLRVFEDLLLFSEYGVLSVNENLIAKNYEDTALAYDTSSRINIRGSNLPLVNKLFLSSRQEHPIVSDICSVGFHNSNVTSDNNKNYASYIECLTYDSDTRSFTNNQITGIMRTDNPKVRVGTYSDITTVGDPYKERIVLYDYNINEYISIDKDGNTNFFPPYFPTEPGLFYSLSLSGLYQPAPQEVLIMTEDKIYIVYGFVAEADILRFDESHPYEGLYGFYNPAQVNSEQTFQLMNCGSALSSCSFVNENRNTNIQYRICSDFNGTQTYRCGDWSYMNPKITNTFTSVGTYGLDFDIFTSYFDEEISKTISLDLSVTSDVNTPQDLVRVSLNPDINVTEIDDTIDDIVIPTKEKDIFQILQENQGTIIGLIAVIAVVATLAAQGIRNPIVLLFAAIVAIVILSVMGLVSSTILVYLLVSIVILIILYVTVFRGNANE